MMDQLPECLQTSVHSLSDFSNLVPTTNTYESSKNIQVATHNVKQAKINFAGRNFQVEIGSR